jgi:hypothetical protein
MKPCVVGIGGAGGNILKQFLQSMDANLVVHQFGEILSFGDVKGIWLESASQDALGQNYYGDLTLGRYPAYLICHGWVSDSSPTRSYVMDTYGFDLKAQGFDRRAEYLKALFEVFENDTTLKTECWNEFKGSVNPLSEYMWKTGIRPYTTIAIGGKSESISTENENLNAEGKASDAIHKRLSDMLKRPKKNGPKSSVYCDSILFLASLGGGTGTGFINPITSFVRSEEVIFPIFALGIMTEKGSDKRHATAGQRYLGAVIAMNDLLTKETRNGIDGLLLIDNQILTDKYSGNYSAMDRHIYQALKPLLDLRNYPGDEAQDDAPAIRRVFGEVDAVDGQDKKNRDSEIRLLPPMFVPCYNIQPDYIGNINTLAEGALGKDGRLFPCDPVKADRALVFTRGFFGTSEIAEAVTSRIHLPPNKIKIYRKLGDSRNEDMLILLRNPYGGSPNEHRREGTLEWRLHEIISLAIKYVDENQTNILGVQNFTDLTNNKLRNYFYGEGGLLDELHNCLDRLESGERPVFQRPLSIFGNSGQASSTVIDGCAADQEPMVNDGDKAKMREMIKSELKDILRSEDCRRRIKEIMQS